MSVIDNGQETVLCILLGITSIVRNSLNLLDL